MESDLETEWLIMLFDDKLRLAWIRGESPVAFTISERRYEESGHGDLTTFYDRLEDRFGRIAGIRVHPVGKTAGFLRNISTFPYVSRSLDDVGVDIYFRSEANHLECTHDQAFGGKWFLASGNFLALSVDFSYLSCGESDRLAMMDAGAEWAVPVA
ncbi:hypothetical protein [Longimicrobium terrae]|uniref:Uncharacterized protein n=1 Tax=Longimicrobium terrae TaxID=1639882 RepID=A0A841H1Z4_9BACT|nr:hypothetical protein [Longimicrobium terrae]MBB4637559.1 hypothetical protein [Longimicrobium terrae]MBB6071956.1 hypothetical protein [Longimicrobium terrae]NNC30502.1 hypothetical protein [Longimicrobium terrae]